MTLSTGEVKICKVLYKEDAVVPFIDCEAPDTISEIHSHDLEAWTLAFLPPGDGVLSGGDDAALKYSSIPSLQGVLKDTKPWLTDNFDGNEFSVQWQNGKIHGAGVTAVLPLSHDIVVTGSYDDHIRVLSVPKSGRRGVLADMNLGGGVWRLTLVDRQTNGSNHHSRLRFLLLASCMHAGARIVEVTRSENGTWSVEVLAKFEEHKSMNYGSDVQPRSVQERSIESRTFVSTSFYDRLVCLWRHGPTESQRQTC